MIVETFGAGVSANDVQAVLVANHGPRAGARTRARRLRNARVLEYLARLEWRVRTMAPSRSSRFVPRRQTLPSQARPKGALMAEVTDSPTLARAGPPSFGILTYARRFRRLPLARVARDDAGRGVDLSYQQFLDSFGQRNDRILSHWLGADVATDVIQRIGDAKEAMYRELARREGLAPLPGRAANG